MNRIALLIFALTSTVCVAQDATRKPETALCGPNRDHLCVAGTAPERNTVTQPALQCPKYQHVQPGHPGYYAQCSVAISVWHEAVPDQCVDDMQEVTEEQWQALKTSIDLLKKMVLLEQEQINLIAGAKGKP